MLARAYVCALSTWVLMHGVEVTGMGSWDRERGVGSGHGELEWRMGRGRREWAWGDGIGRGG